MFPTLNRSAPYGSIMGVLATHPTARFEQNGRMFDATGACVDITPEEYAEAERIAAERAEMDAAAAGDSVPVVQVDQPEQTGQTAPTAEVVTTTETPPPATETVVGNKRKQPPPAV